MALLEWVAAMATVCKDSAAGERSGFILGVRNNRIYAPIAQVIITVSQLVIWVVPGQFLQVIFEQQLITRNPLDRFQHVVLQGQAATYFLALKELKGRYKKARSGLLAVRCM